MPKVRFKSLIEEIHGTMYDVVFKKSPKGNMIVTKRPDMTGVEWSAAQETQRQRFKQANDYAKAAMADPNARVIYEKRGKRTHRSPFRLAFSDYFKGKDLLAKK
jgi:hypothetical protein